MQQTPADSALKPQLCVNFQYKKEKFRSEGRKTQVSLVLQRKRLEFLEESEEILDFLHFSPSKIEEFLAKDEKVLENLRILRQITCFSQGEAVLREVLSSNLMNFLRKYLETSSQSAIHSEVLWILVNLSSLASKEGGFYDFSQIIVAILQKLARKPAFFAEEAQIAMIFWFFYNLCVDSMKYQHVLFENGLISYLQEVWPCLRNSQTCKHNLIELVLSLSLEKTAYVSHCEEILLLFPIIETCFRECRENHKYLVNILWIFKQMTDNSEKSFEFLLKMQSFGEFLQCLRAKDAKVAEITLKIVNNLLSGSNEQIQVLLDRNLLDLLLELTESPRLAVRRDVCFGFSNICAADSQQIDTLFAHDILNEVIKLAFIDDISVKAEVGISMANLCIFATKQQKLNLLNRGLLQIFADLLEQYPFHEEKFLVRILEGLAALLQLGKALKTVVGRDLIRENVEKTRIPRVLEELQEHANEKIYQLCYKLLDIFFGDEAEECE